MNGDPGDLLAIGSAFVVYLVGVGVALFGIVSLWRILEKGGRRGWPALVPLYGAIELLRLLGRPAWWIVLLLIPVVNLVAFTLVCLSLARSFGKGGGFVLGLVLLHVVYLTILAFGPDSYRAPRDESGHQKSLSNP